MKLISEIEDLNKKKVLLRVDFNVPVENGRLMEIYRLEAHRLTIEYLVKNGSIIVLLAHLGDDESESFLNLVGQFSDFYKKDIEFIPETGDIENKIKDALPGSIFLLDNIRKWPLKNVLDTPSDGKILILGGAKISTKAPVIKGFIEHSDAILIGGAVANQFFKFKGVNVGSSRVEKIALEDLGFDIGHPRILLPQDMVISSDMTGVGSKEVVPVQNIADDQKILDIGPETIKRFSKLINDSKLIVWNGPMGLAEVGAFSEGTKQIVSAIFSSSSRKVVGGGDTIAFLEKESLLDKFSGFDKSFDSEVPRTEGLTTSFVSTGGGAMLEFLAGNQLPGLVALGYYQ
ncbi:MAG: phosphoglycerate kinase [Parcubacteria group bacterium]|nr:phosphoglycerate kinase [Parcubacteria group bacterium]